MGKKSSESMELRFDVRDVWKNEEINSFFNIFHNTHRTKEEFEWEFCMGPAGKSIYVNAVTGEGKIVGAFSVIPLEMTDAGGGKFLTGKPEDTMVDIFARLMFRKKDILKEMYSLIEEECRKMGIQFLWGFTYETSSFKRLGFVTSFQSLQGVYVMKPIPAYEFLCSLNSRNGLKQKIQIASLVLFSWVNKYRTFFISGKVRGTITDTLHPGHSALLREHLRSRGEFFCLNQDEMYIKWRTEDNPNLISYKFAGLTGRDGKLEAEIIYSISGRIAFIEQMLFTNRCNRQGILALLNDVCRKLKKENVSLVRFMGFNANSANSYEMRLLKKFGFVFLNRGIPFVFKNIGTAQRDMKPSDIFLSRLFTQGTQ
jgi:hypothetical protein